MDIPNDEIKIAVFQGLLVVSPHRAGPIVRITSMLWRHVMNRSDHSESTLLGIRDV